MIRHTVTIMVASNAKMDIIYQEPHAISVGFIVHSVRHTIHAQNVSEENMELNVTVIVETHVLRAQRLLNALNAFLEDMTLTASHIVP